MKNFGLRLTDCRKCYFLIFVFFIFPSFKCLLSKIFWEVHPFLQWISSVLKKFFYVTNIFDLHTFDNETTALLKFFEISAEIHFVSLFFITERNISTSLLMIHLKCTIVYYANLNWSSINKPYLRTVEYAILFFSISYLYLKTFWVLKTFYWKTIIF